MAKKFNTFDDWLEFVLWTARQEEQFGNDSIFEITHEQILQKLADIGIDVEAAWKDHYSNKL